MNVVYQVITKTCEEPRRISTGVHDDADSGRDPCPGVAGGRPPGAEEDGGHDQHGRNDRRGQQHRRRPHGRRSGPAGELRPCRHAATTRPPIRSAAKLPSRNVVLRLAAIVVPNYGAIAEACTSRTQCDSWTEASECRVNASIVAKPDAPPGQAKLPSILQGCELYAIWA